MTDFEGWLRKGLGRAAVFLRANDSRPWRAQLLYACTHYLTYDAQCEESRAHYLLDLIEISGDADFYRDRIIEALASEDEELDPGQMFEVAASFAAKGSTATKQAMYAAFDRYGFDGAGLTAAEQLVILDGLSGLLFSMKSFGEVEPDERPWQFRHLIEVLEKHHGQRTLPSVLDRFVRELQEQERVWESDRPKTRPDYEEIKRRILEKGRNVSIVYWSKNATDEEMAKLARDVLLETDCDRLRGFLRMFQLRKFPGPMDRLIELARGSHEGVARAAMYALSHFSDPAVRDLALETAHKADWRRVAIEMLIRNREANDYRILERILEEQLDPDDYHDFGIGVRYFVEAHMSEDAERSLLLLYENEPCSLCRRGAVKELIAINRVPQWMIEECRCDAYSETRKMFSKS